MNNRKVFGIVIVLAAIILAIFLWPRKAHGPQTGQNAQVVDFASCSAAGNEVLQTYPAQCRTADGQIFVEELGPQADAVVDQPMENALIKSPVSISGKAKGNWFFEASLPVVITDANGKELGRQPFMATGEWQTTAYVPFSGTMPFEKPATDTGFVIVSKDNPSGDPARDASVKIPVKFK
jgi:hypothetical protein